MGTTRDRAAARRHFPAGDGGDAALTRYRPGMARPSLKALFQNFDDYDAPLDRKVRKALRNNAKKVLTLSQCCGHPGEPGC
jgi:hypothetical protein